MKKNNSDLTEYPRMCLGQYPIRDLQFSPASDQIAVVRRNSVLIYDAETGAEISLITRHTASITAIFFNPDGKTLMSACEKGTICISETSTGKCTGTIHDYEGEFVAFSPDGNSFAAKSWGLADWEVDKIHVFDIATSTLVQTIRADGRSGFLGVVFSPDGKTLAISEYERNILDGPCPISIWDISTGTRLKTLTVVGGGAYSIVFSPDGRKLADSGGLWDHRIALWDVGTGTQCCVFGPQNNVGYADVLAFSLDGSMLVSGHSDGRVLLLNVNTGEQLNTFIGHTAKVSSLCFSPDGSSLATGCEDGTVMLWDILN
ncbi:WD40 repeat domain-containing protein [Candidatus Poribacteria bacterium]|nr:WD40 repeat domain-containing protein [Candidatus Poribacteria bacterium]